MRADDILCAKQVPNSHMTQKMYLPEGMKYGVMSNEQLRRGLCPKSGGRWEACKACQGGCQAGRLLVDRMEGRSQEPEMKVRDTKEFALKLIKPEDRDVPVMTKAEAAMADRLEQAMKRYVKAMQRIAAGETVTKACKAVGYASPASLYSFRTKHKDACMAAMAVAGIPLALAEAEPKRTRAGNPKIDEAIQRRQAKAMDKYVRVMRRVAAGENVDEACAAEGYGDGRKTWLNQRRRNEEACKAALEAAGVPDIDVRRRKR